MGSAGHLNYPLEVSTSYSRKPPQAFADNHPHRFYLIFCIATPLAAVFAYFFVKETKGLSLEEIDLLFAKPAHRAEIEAQLRGGGHASSEDKGSSEMVEQNKLPSKV